MVSFYQSVGTEDAFRMLFRLLFNEDIELYYPSKDLLIASGGDYIKQARIRVNSVDYLNDIENKKIVGATSGAYGTVEKVQILPKGSDSLISGKMLYFSDCCPHIGAFLPYDTMIFIITVVSQHRTKFWSND